MNRSGTARQLLLAIIVTLAGVTTSYAYDFESDGIYYNTITDSTVEVTHDTTVNKTYNTFYSGYITIPDTVYVTIPDTVTNDSTTTTYTVTAIGDSAFFYCTKVTGVTMPNTVKSIGDCAFYYCWLAYSKGIVISTGVESIGDSAFFNGLGIDVIDTTLSSLKSIGDYAFYQGSLDSIVIPNSVESIGKYAFYQNTSLVKVTIGSGVKSMGDYAFSCNKKLETVTVVDDSVSNTVIGDYAFYNGFSNTNYKSPYTSVTIGSGCKSIGFAAFAYSSDLESVIIGDSVESIGRTAFYNCTALDSVVVKSGSIGQSAFRYCYALKSLTIGSGVTSIGYAAFYTDTCLTKVTMDEGLTSIGYYAFWQCINLEGIKIPNSVTSIGYGAFYECYDLASLTIGNSVTTIDGYAFAECTSLTSVEIPDKVTILVTGAFYRCENLKSVTLGNGLITIGDGAFQECYSLESIKIPNNVTSIGYCAFFRCYDMASLTIGNSVTTIGSAAFSECYKLPCVKIPNSVTSIGTSAFYFCVNLGSVTIGKNVKSIGDDAFRSCPSLQSIYCLMEDASSVTCGDSIFWIDGDEIETFVFENAVLFVPDEGTLETYRAADQWKDFTRVAVTRYMDEGETIAAGDELNIISTTTSSSTTENIKAIAETTSEEDGESSGSETLYAVVTFGSTEGSSEEDTEGTSVWSEVAEESELDVVGPFSYYAKGNVAATNESGYEYDPTSEDNNTFDAPITGAYLMMEPKADGTIYVAIKKQGDVYVCDETGTKVDYLMAELPNGVFECYGSSSEETDTTDTEETSESESASSTEETDSCIRYSFPALAGKTYFVTSTNDNCLSVAGYAFEPDSLEAPFAANTLTISDSSEDNLEESDTITTGQYDVTLTRNFYEGGWTSMVLPFSVSPSMLKEVFGDDAAIIYYDKVQNDTLYLTEHYHQMIVAGTPMFIRPDTTATSLTFKCVTYGEPTLSYSSDNGTYSVDSQELPSIEENIIGCEDNESDWKLTGSYTPTTTVAHVYMIGFTMSDTDNDNTDDTVDSNNFYEYTTAQNVSGMRAWLEDVTEDNSAAKIASVFNGGVSDDSETTGIINALMGEGTATGRSDYGNGNIYNLHGQMVRRAGEGTVGLPAGIYIVNGRKVAVK